MGFASFARRVLDEGFRKGIRVFHRIGMLRIEPRNRIEGGRGEAGHTEGIEDMHRPEPVPRFRGDHRILALGVDAEDRAIEGEQVEGIALASR